MSNHDDPQDQLLSSDLMGHLIELRQRLMYCIIVFMLTFSLGYYFSDQIFHFLVSPLAKLLENESGRRLIYTGLTEAFVTYLKVGFFTACFLTFPVIAFQIWKFIAPGLFKKEKKVVLPLLIATPVLFIMGACFAFFLIIPSAWNFFLSFESTVQGGLPIQLEARVQEYLSLVMQLILAFGISFQLPLVLILLGRVGIIGHQALARNRKYSFLLIMVASAFLTPPDVLSMLGLALPLYALYELSILAVWYSASRDVKVSENKGVESA